MKFKFKARICKVGINPCVPVPKSIASRLTQEKGFVAVKGTIEGYAFVQTLVPVKGQGYRLYVNRFMLEGARVANGDSAVFVIERDLQEKSRETPQMPGLLKQKLKATNLTAMFEELTPSRKKDIIRYLSNLKSIESLSKNVNRLVKELQSKKNKTWITR